VGRWPGRIAGLAAALIAGAVVTVTIPAGADPAWSGPAITIRDAGGAVLASAPLPADGRFALRYRNSVYGTLAEERFVVGDDGRFRLVELAADQLAVLEEYYAVTRPAVRTPPGGRRAWSAPPARPLVLEELRVAATDLGRRTLLVDDRSLALWRLVDADPTVILTVEGVDA
jgi:hypothetical protein